MSTKGKKEKKEIKITLCKVYKSAAKNEEKLKKYLLSLEKSV